MNEEKYTKRVKWLVVAGAALLIFLLLGAWITEGLNKEWRRAQREYRQLLREKSGDEGSVVAGQFERGISQVNLPQFNRTDRCISCHNGLENPSMKGVPQPHGSHPGSFLSDHPVQQFGCTICHGGQGRALTRDDAAGRLPETHWNYPLLEQPYIQASCGKCHLAIYNHVEGVQQESINGMEVFLRGKSIFASEGCLGCHQARGVGGIIGPDLTEQGEKTRHEYSFQNILGEQTISNWLKEHFKDPEMVSPGSQMLSVNLEEHELEALATFVMGLAKPGIPFDYFSLSALNEFKGIREPMDGAAGFAALCSACHGKDGEGKSYEDYKTGIPAIGNPAFLRVASPEYIRFTLEKGRSLRQMGSWTTGISGMKPAELDSLTAFLTAQPGLKIENRRRVSGNPDRGRKLFDYHCVTCHGPEGKGGVAVALNQQGFLGKADDALILGTLVRGRRNSAMPGWAHLQDRELGDLLSLLRSWSKSMPPSGQMELPEADLKQGALKYHYLCSRCHGESGEGETGPSIINRDFLEVAGNGYLYRTIATGRPHTAMFGWSSDVYNQEQLKKEDISNIIAFMRTSAEAPFTYVYPGTNPGNRENGALLFKQHCATCHGGNGEGTRAPALNNQELLNAASNGYLLATITIGREGTPMPSWGYNRGDHPVLSGSDRQDLVAFLRSFQRIRIKY